MLLVLLLLEAAAVAVIVAGVVLIAGIGAGMIVAGVLGVVACEWLSARRPAPPPTTGRPTS